MKCFLFVLVLATRSIWANEDVLLDLITDVMNDGEVEKRAVLNALTSSAVADAAKVFAGNMGWSKSLNRPVSQAFEDACLGSSGPLVNPNPLPWNSRINPFGSSSAVGPYPTGSGWPVGKREEERLANRDIIFVLDSSGSIPSDQFEKAKKAINVLVESFCPTKFGNEVSGEGTKQISVVVFDSRVTTEVDFSESSRGAGYLKDKILSIKHRMGSTATGTALNYVRTKVLGQGKSRLNHPKVSTDVIVITDGQCNVNCRVLGTEANTIRKMGHGVNVFAMGVAKARACELEIISGKGATNLAFGLGDFRNFDRFATAVKELAQENSNKCA